ncbi:MAG: hypothetical protein PF450_14415 [Bacteroidales bacterium]|jgi:hypothetical protein|nr:hypothetical protein [Bacteroidales bacterium]
MIERLLKAKHWQLFLLVFGLPFVFYIGWMISFVSGIVDSSMDNFSSDYPIELFNKMTILLVLMLIPIGIKYAWFWSMGMGLQKKLPHEMTMKTNRFRVFFIIPIVFMLFYYLFLSLFFGDTEWIDHLESIEEIQNIGMIVLGFFFFILLSLFVTFCTFYQYWFKAKTIKSSVLKKEAVFSDFVGEFFLLWFYPIGVWILQPMINKLVEDKTEN